MTTFMGYGDAPDISGVDTSGGASTQGQAVGLARLAATGQLPSAADAQMRAGLLRAQQSAASTAASTRGNFGLAGAQRSAQAQEAQLGQQAVNTSAQLRAEEQARGMNAYLQGSEAQRSSALQAAQIAQQRNIAAAQMQEQQNQGLQQLTTGLIGGAAGLGSAGITALAMMPAEKLVSQSAAGEAAAPAAASFAPGVKSMTGGGNLGFGAQEYLQSDPGIADVVPQNELNPYPGEFMGDLSDPYSDARLKSPTYGDDQAAQDFIHTLKPHTYNWKDPGHAPNPEAARQPNLGVYAQDIEKSPWGQAIVQDDGRGGAKTLDHKALMSALAAGLGHTAKKQDEHERRLSLLEMALTGGR